MGGEESVQEGGSGGGGGGMDIFDLLSGRQPQRQNQGKRKGKDISFELEVTLEQI